MSQDVVRSVFCELLESRQFLTTVPAGFGVSTLVSGLDSPTTMAFAPDGRLFVSQQTGDLRVIKDGQLLPTPFLSLPVDSQGERGLLGIAFDPNFSADHFVYVYYTATTPVIHNRVSRFTANGDVADPNSEKVLIDLPALGQPFHNGGAIHFGPDGDLYIAVGENTRANLAPGLDTVFGKILRIAPDGSIPTDNPFVSQTTGQQQAIWAKGLRNPFTFAFQPGSGLMLIDDVGLSSEEEIDPGIPGADYGWPSTEGDPHGAPGITAPIYTYDHSQGSAIIGAAFMPDGRYYFGDLTGGFIRALDPTTNTVTPFATGLPTVVGLTPGPDGNLYVLTRQSTGQVLKITGDFSSAPVNRTPQVTITGIPSNFQYTAGKTVKFSLTATDLEDGKLSKKSISYKIQRVVNGTVDKLLATGKNTTSAKFKIPTKNVPLGTNVVYRITATATDSAGGIGTAIEELSPKLHNLTITSNIPGLPLTLDGTQITTPTTLPQVTGLKHKLVASKIITLNNTTFKFTGWTGLKKTTSRTLDIVIPDHDATLLAKYKETTPAP